jgi:hypothetical protein
MTFLIYRDCVAPNGDKRERHSVKPFYPYQYSVEEIIIFFSGVTAPSEPGSLRYRGFTVTLKRTKIGRNPLDEWSARLRDLYPKKHNTHSGQTCMPPAGFEPAFPASKRPQNHALDSAANGKDLMKSC